jgi:hypothetical protein
MSMASKLAERARAGKPIRIGLIGAGKFGSMFLSQAPRALGLHVAGIADLDIDRARRATTAVGWPSEKISAKSIEEALGCGGSFLTDDANALIAADGIEVIVEATGNPGAGIAHALACCKHGRHDGQCGGGRAGGTSSCPSCFRSRDHLLPRLRRSAGPHRGAGRVGARVRFRDCLRGQGYEVPACLSQLDAGDRLGPLRLHRGPGRCGRLQRKDVQLVSRRDEVGDRDGGRGQRHGARRSGRRPRFSGMRRRRSAVGLATKR